MESIWKNCPRIFLKRIRKYKIKNNINIFYFIRVEPDDEYKNQNSIVQIYQPNTFLLGLSTYRKIQSI